MFLQSFLTELYGSVYHSDTVYCCNPNCSDPIIRDDKIPYDEQLEAVYHARECWEVALAEKLFHMKGPMMVNLVHISREEALDLKKKGKLLQPSELSDLIS